MSNATDYDYWTLRALGVRMMEPTIRFATRQEARNARAAFLNPSPWKIVHVVNRRKKAEAQRDELLTLARKLVELEEWVASTMTSNAKGMTIDVSWTGELSNIIAEAKLALEKTQ